MAVTECELQIPDDVEVIETPIGHFWFDNEGILYSIGKRGPRNMKMVKESMRILKSILGDKKTCLITDTSNTSYYTIEMREELTRAFSKFIKAVALVPCTPSGKIIGSILFMRKADFPVKFFKELKEARKWIKQFC